MPEIVEFADEHLDDAARLLAARHARHRRAEPLLPDDVDFRAELEREWRADGASGVFAFRGGTPVGYLVGRPLSMGGTTWLVAGIAGHAVDYDAEVARDLYGAAAAQWFDDGYPMHAVYVPSHDAELVDAWFRLCFGASGVFAMRETTVEPAYPADVVIRDGTAEDVTHAARLEYAMAAAMVPGPSFSNPDLESVDARAEEWHGTWGDETYAHFVAERDGEVVGHLLLYRRPPDLRVPRGSIDLAQASTVPEARGSGVGRALTAHALTWAHEHGIPVMTTDWRMTNLWASRFWPRRGFRTTFLRLYRHVP